MNDVIAYGYPVGRLVLVDLIKLPSTYSGDGDFGLEVEEQDDPKVFQKVQRVAMGLVPAVPAGSAIRHILSSSTARSNHQSGTIRFI
jgi:hypothetical protein